MSELGSLRCLVTGGAGYVGSHVVRALRAHGSEVVALDNLYSGHRWAVSEAELVVADVGDASTLTALLSARRFDALLHFAVHIWVGESMANPGKYYGNSTTAAANLFALAARHGVHMSSSPRPPRSTVNRRPSRSRRRARSRRSIPMARRR
jgi:UDP-glucose 4-epimerase